MKKTVLAALLLSLLPLPRTARAIAFGAVGPAKAESPHPLKTWVKRHPLPKVQHKPAPRMGYETTYGYDGRQKLLIRYGGHNQGGGGEQNSEVWTYDLAQDAWTLKEPNDAPPGVCCGQQNVFDNALGLFLRFPAFSGSHGWQSRREIDLKNSSVWTYDLPTNTWRAMRPCPEVWPSPLRGAAYDPHHQVTVLHGGEGSRHGTVAYDLYANAWYELKPRGGPEPGVSQPGFTYDPVHRLFVLFGSQFQDDERTWVYDLRKNAWRVLDVKEHPPGKQSCPVLAADSRSGIVLCSVQAAAGKEREEGASRLETWVLDVSVPRWMRLNVPREPDPSGARNRVLVHLPDENLFVLENRTKDEQQIWTLRYSDALPPIPGPKELRVVTESNAAKLTWQAPEGTTDQHYRVFRGQGAKPWEVEWKPIADNLRETRYRDENLERGTVYQYQVQLGGYWSNENAASSSWIVRSQPPVVVDLTASVLGPRKIELQWAQSSAEDVVGYQVERADVSVYSTDQIVPIKERYRSGSDLAVGRIKRIGQFRRLTGQPLKTPEFADTTADLAAEPREPAEPALAGAPLAPDRFDAKGKPYRYAVYAYRVVAVNRLGAESGPSPLVFTFPSAVQHVFAKEEGKDKTRLKWRPNREQGIAGYLVDRHDGRWDKDTISRLTPRPIASQEFLDEKSGTDTRRYEILAVDILGQEGEPSQPVWSRREWARFYVPYVGEWHQ